MHRGLDLLRELARIADAEGQVTISKPLLKQLFDDCDLEWPVRPRSGGLSGPSRFSAAMVAACIAGT
jgi:hypothetical protein